MSAQGGIVAAFRHDATGRPSDEMTVTISIKDGISLRPSRTDDDAACGRIIAAATLASALPDRLPHARDLWIDASPLSPEGRTRLIAERDSMPVGFADYDPERGHVRYLFVSPDMQGHGIGSYLLDYIQEDLSQALSVHCLAVNDAAVRWYLHHGFAVTGGFLRDLEGKEAVWFRLTREFSG